MKHAMTNDLNEFTSCKGRIRRFRQDEEGGMIIFSLFMLVLILTLGGMAVDFMRFETTRAKLQGTLDRATLAAADLDQTLPPADVVRDYFAKAGMSQFLQGDPIIGGTINHRIVTANAEAQIPMFFLDLPRVFMSPFAPGMSAITVSGTSTAEERVNDVEISLVLDVSGSMNDNGRIVNMRKAATSFVTTVLDYNTDEYEGLVTVSLVPYSAVVNIGSQVEPHIPNINRTHDYSTCLLFDDADFLTTALDLSKTYDHVSHFDQGWYYPNDYINDATIDAPFCYQGDLNSIRAHTTSASDLHLAIKNLEAFGATSIDMGVKWGVGLLDESTNDIVRGLVSTAVNAPTPVAAETRPEPFSVPDVLKVVVLMTDGDNTEQRDLRDVPSRPLRQYKTGLSFIWFNYDSDSENLIDVPRARVSIQYEGNYTTDNPYDDAFYRPGVASRDRWEDYPIGYSSRDEYRTAFLQNSSATRAPGRGVEYPGDVHNHSWQELFAVIDTRAISGEWLSRPYNEGAISYNGGDGLSYYGPLAAVDSSVTTSTEADDRLEDICRTARTQGIIIYTVAFEAPSAGRAALQKCASSDSHYFSVNGPDIELAFDAIAADIRALKLTQ